MGCTQYLVMLATKPEYNKKVKLGFLLAPAAFMSHSPNIIFQISSLADDIEVLYQLFGLYEFLPHRNVERWLGKHICGSIILPLLSEAHPLLKTVCMNIGFSLLGFTPGQLNGTMVPSYLDHIPEGTSTRPFVHFAQLHKSGRFESYDYGPANFDHYGQKLPITYDLSKVTAPTAIFKGDADSLTALEDINRCPSCQT